MSKAILIVDDDVELCSLMKDFFAQQGFRTECAHDGHTGLLRALEGRFDLVILDAMLPVLDGFELLRRLRKQSGIPVIMLTARTAQNDKIKGLDAGADDYLPKPFGPEELAARVRAVLRRFGKAQALKADVMESGGLKLDARARDLRYLGDPVELTSVEFDILELLMAQQGALCRAMNSRLFCISAGPRRMSDRWMFTSVTCVRNSSSRNKAIVRRVQQENRTFAL